MRKRTVIRMRKIKYEIGYDLFSLVPASVLLLVFGGTTVILKIKNNGMFIFTGLLSLAVIAIIAAVLYAHFFKKIIIDDEGFYYKNGISKAKYYKFTDIKEAWESSGMARNGANQYYLNFKTTDGIVKKFVFTATNSDGVDFLIGKVMGDKQDEEQ